MNTDLADEQLDATRKRESGATPGPWTRFDRTGINDDDDFLGHEIEGPPDASRGQFARVGDAEFIACARTDIPVLLAEVDRLRAVVKHLTEHRTCDGCQVCDPYTNPYEQTTP